MYNQFNQYRCTIIRGKSKKELDDLLPAYAKVIDEICPCPKQNFARMFNDAFQKYLPDSNIERKKKTLDNHRTEIAGKLFGMFYEDGDDMVYASERTRKFLNDNDQPAFFKDICYKMQFPNGMHRTSDPILQQIKDSISIRPNAFILKLLLLANQQHLVLTQTEIGYYVLNSLDVLQGKASPSEVLEAIKKDRASDIERTIIGNNHSYCWQHIKEQLNYLELANLIYEERKEIYLNMREQQAIEIFAEDWDKKPLIDVYSYDLQTREGWEYFRQIWGKSYSSLSASVSQFTTRIEALLPKETVPQVNGNDGQDNQGLMELGDEGERIVYEYEKRRVASYNQRLANKVLALGKTKGLGYDIQSVIAEPGDSSEFVKYIEVKSTKRTTIPNLKDNLWMDTLNITRNEWIAAQQHGAFYAIFRVYFTREGVLILVLDNVSSKLKQQNLMTAIPMTYRVDFNGAAIDKVIRPDINKEM